MPQAETVTPPDTSVLAHSRLATFNDLSMRDMILVRDSLKCAANIEGRELEDLRGAIFLFYKSIFMALEVHVHRSGKELYVAHMGGDHFKTHAADMWEILKALATRFECRWIGADARKRSHARMYKSLDLKIKEYHSFMFDMKEEGDEPKA